jgi:hypothetical protein
VLGVGAATLLSACAFGEIGGSGEPGLEADREDADESIAPRAEAWDAIVPGAESDPDSTAPAEPPPAAGGSGADDDLTFQSPLGQQVLGVLERNCAQCHSEPVGASGLSYVLDL